MMEVNKEEAKRCIGYAEMFILDGKKDKAEKFLLKAERLFPTQKAKDLLEQVKTYQPQAEQEGEPRKRHVLKKESDEQPQYKEHQQQSKSSASDKEYNKEDLEAVKRIDKCKDYYQILGVSKEATDSDIRKAYKKLALQLHPDKNKCPGATEAFKAISNAFAILTDPEKRMEYDLNGSDEGNLHHEYNYTRGFEADITAEELFNMNFGGQNVYTERGQHTEYHSQYGESRVIWCTVFLQMLPILLIVLGIMSIFCFSSDSIYSLHKSSTYPVQRKTRNQKLPYFVKEDFRLDYRGRRNLEKIIEEKYVQKLKHACLMEKSYRKSLKMHARFAAHNDLLREAWKMPMPSCDKLRDFEAQAG
jgi:DnaJ family protein B protein 12